MGLILPILSKVSAHGSATIKFELEARKYHSFKQKLPASLIQTKQQ